jgi:hypothetical protein
VFDVFDVPHTPSPRLPPCQAWAAKGLDEANQKITLVRSQNEAAERRIAMLEEMLRNRDSFA